MQYFEVTKMVQLGFKKSIASKCIAICNNKHFCYDGESPINIDNEKKHQFLQYKEKYKNNKESYTGRRP